jgi:hypothetical protein
LSQPNTRVPRTWRTPLGLIVALMLTVVLTLPLMGVFFFRIYENQLVHQTEAELIAQSAVLAAAVAREAAAIPPADLPLGMEARKTTPTTRSFRPWTSQPTISAPAGHPRRPLLPLPPRSRGPISVL